MTGQNSFSRKISEFQAEGLGFQNFAWLGSNPSYAPDIPPNIHKARIVVMPRKERDVNSN